MSSLTSIPTLSTEQKLTALLKHDIADFWQQGTFSSFQGVDNICIHYAVFQHHEDSQNENLATTTRVTSNKSLVIVSGRSECYLKYQELCFDFYQQGYDVFIIDHRGQGLSERIIDHPQKGYVVSFEHYVDDLATFIDDIVLTKNTNKPYLLGHSMGGAIVARYLQRFPNTSQAAVLSSPMIGISSGAVPHIIASFLIKAINKINQWFDPLPWYFFGHKDHTLTKFKDNILMHSEIRYQIFSQLYQSTPAIQLGGVTIKWLRESLRIKELLFKDIGEIKTPVLILQSGDEHIVDNQAQDEFCQKLSQVNPSACPNNKPVIINGAFHELFFESDIYRNKALTATINWFKQH